MWNYVVINSGEEYGEFLAHSAKGTTWDKHKYIKKETKGGKTRYYYADSNGKETGKVNTELTATDNGPGYELDDGDKEYMENHKAGTDTRTYEQYMSDKQKAIKAADEEADAKNAANTKQETEEERKKKNRQTDSEIAKKAGRAFVKRYI